MNFFLGSSLAFMLALAPVSSYADNWMTFETEEICGDAEIPCQAKKMEATFVDGTKVTCMEATFNPEGNSVTLKGSGECPALLVGKLPTEEAYAVESSSFTLHKHQHHLTVDAEAPLAIYLEGWGDVHVDGRMELVFALTPLKKVETLHLEGIINLKSARQGSRYCRIPGKLFFDFEQGIIKACSFSSSSDNRAREQIYFEDDLGGLFTDAITIYYDTNTHHPSKYILEGNVRVKNIFAVNETLMGKLDQHAVADKIEYDLYEGKAILNAQSGHRVLFLDQANKMQVSAGELHILFDKETKTPSIKGIGDVRLTFGEKELKKMEKVIREFESHKVLPD